MSTSDLLLPETLLWSWRKVRRCYQGADSMFDQAELAAFELNLENELESIRSDFALGQWSTKPIRLVPQPKKPNKEGLPRLRQYFEVPVRDQVAWTAVATVLGPEIDRLMPAWSYGNRLYRAAWYEEETSEGRGSKLNIGPYRHAGGHLYRHFKHSWPLYRRHISLTARKMVGSIDLAELDEGDRRALDQDEGLAYLDGSYWSGKKPKHDTIYALSFDLMKFYPNIRHSAILRGFEILLNDSPDKNFFFKLLEDMLRFEVDESGLTEEMGKVVEPSLEPGPFSGIPTGLFVGGLLANIAMLPLDLKVEELLRREREIAHFRFVDDHEILSYDFKTAVEWINKYRKLLKEFEIGVEVEPEKYSPPALKWLIHSELLDDFTLGDRPLERGDELVNLVAKAAEVNGRKPTELMTRTLGQVSMLAATDFDLLTDAGRNQRLEQLEWLLLANIPEQEIRGDTRMAFAAAKIASLTPALFKPNEELLKAHRQLQELLHKQVGTDRQRRVSTAKDTRELRKRIKKLEKGEQREWDNLRARHFGLLFEAFISHPDKTRLFIRLIDYCRSTGHDGFKRITDWMGAHKADEFRLLKSYLGAMGLQVLSRHILTASVALGQRDLLHRERACAREFLNNVVKAKLDEFVPLSPDRSPALHRFQLLPKRTLTAALVLGAFEVERVTIAPVLGLAAAMRKRAARILGGSSTLADLQSADGVSIGIWYHWLLSITRAWTTDPPTYWPQIQQAHDINDSYDWISLRRYPADFPVRGWDRLSEEPGMLKQDDAGWLIEAARAAPQRFQLLSAENSLVAMVRQKIDAVENGLSLREWVSFTQQLHPADPRRSEWTALEISRQILGRFADVDGPDPDAIDRLQPENVLIPNAWRNLGSAALQNDITWESWQKLVRTPENKVTLTKLEIEDYRYRELLGEGDGRWAWARRLRPVGQLLWGTLRGSFQLPSAWNIRGQERDLIGAVAWDLERLPISSCTLAILEACLLPRSVETAFLEQRPDLFGNQRRKSADDTEFDRQIYDTEDFTLMIKEAQATLAQNQMTVLNHQPRQLIPVQLHTASRLVGAAAPLDEELQ